MKKQGKFKGFVKVLGDPNKKTLLSEQKIAEFLTMGCALEGDEVGLYLASSDVSACCGFKFDEWGNFVKRINEANKNLKEIFKK